MEPLEKDREGASELLDRLITHEYGVGRSDGIKYGMERIISHIQTKSGEAFAEGKDVLADQYRKLVYHLNKEFKLQMSCRNQNMDIEKTQRLVNEIIALVDIQNK